MQYSHQLIQLFCPGLSPSAPLTFACFGSYLAKLGNLLVGYRFALLGKTLLNKLGAHESTGELIGVVSPCSLYRSYSLRQQITALLISTEIAGKRHSNVCRTRSGCQRSSNPRGKNCHVCWRHTFCQSI